MKNLAVLNGTAITPLAAAPLGSGTSALERSLAFARRLSGVGEPVVLCRNKERAWGSVKTVGRDDWNARVFLEELARLGKGCDHIFYFFADCPFLDAALADRLFADHVKYYSDYTFADGYPYGLSVEIIKTSIIEPLLGLVKETDAFDRETVFNVLRKDINAFDLETEIAPVDLRQLRLSLTADTRRNYLLCQAVEAAGGRDEPSILDVVQRKPELLRTLPAYVSVQIVEGCPQVCSYCPYPTFRGDILGKKAEMKADDFNRLVRGIKEFSGDAVISVSLWGEPSLHSRIDDLIGSVLDTDGLDLVIETSGLGWEAARLKNLAGGLKRPPSWIVSLDAWTEAAYRPLRGEGFAEAAAAARTLMELFPGRVYVQAVRMKENEATLEEFYREWKKTTENVIIQKYDHFAGFLPQRKVADLSPLRRPPCWHCKRDLVVLLDGTVPLCREDVKAVRPLGNLLTEPLAAVWARGEAVYREHLAQQYAAPCKDCDEFYTFNF